MSKSCTLCAHSDVIKSFVVERRALGLSSRDIAKALKDVHGLTLSYSSIDRHLDHAMPKNTPVKAPKGERLHLDMMSLFDEGLGRFSRKLRSVSEETMLFKDYYDTFRALDVMCNVFEKLFPNGVKPNVTGDMSEGVSQKMLDLLISQGYSSQDAAQQILTFDRLMTIAKEVHDV